MKRLGNPQYPNQHRPRPQYKKRPKYKSDPIQMFDHILVKPRSKKPLRCTAKKPDYWLNMHQHDYRSLRPTQAYIGQIYVCPNCGRKWETEPKYVAWKPTNPNWSIMNW